LVLDCLLPYCPRVPLPPNTASLPPPWRPPVCPSTLLVLHSASSVFIVALILSPMQATLAISLDSSTVRRLTQSTMDWSLFQSSRWCSRASQPARSTFRFHHHLDAMLAGQWRFTLCRDLRGGTAMSYSFTPPPPT
jgi:hypothetical protein